MEPKIKKEYKDMNIDERRVYRTGQEFPNRKQRRAAKSRFEKDHGFLAPELHAVMQPYRKTKVISVKKD